VSIEGEIVVRLERSDRVVRQVTMRSTRPQAAARVAIGRPPDVAAALVPSLYAVCARAQGAAAAEAVAAACGQTPAPRTRAAREAAVLLESLHEYLRCLLIDGPQAQGQPAEVAPVAEARRAIAPALARVVPRAIGSDGAGPDDDAPAGSASDGSAPHGSTPHGSAPDDIVAPLAALLKRHVYGADPAHWLADDAPTGLADWAAVGATLPARLLRELLAGAPTYGGSDVALMPPAGHESLLAAVVPALRSQAGYERAPTWAGAAVETGPLARTQAHPVVAPMRAAHGNAVATRMVARLVELAQLPARIGAALAASAARASPTCGIDALELAPGEGLAAVQTARGLLLHRARVAGGCVADYQIVAPTEWNFHPRGALVRGLEGVPADDAAALVRRATLLVHSLDPCVACRVEVAGA
jgi:hypothetical protein